MTATLALPAVAATARRASRLYTAWTADPDMPDVAGCAEDAVRVFAVRAAVAETAGERAAALAAPGIVELTGRLLTSQFPELAGVLARTGHTLIHGADGRRWEPGDHLHQVYVGAFGPVGGRHWPV